VALVNLPTALLLAWLQACAAINGVEPEFALAVAAIESRLQCGPLGRSGTYYGPMGIHKCFKAKWDIEDPYVNIAVGVSALRGRDQRRVLKRYNASFNEAYWRAVQAARRQYQRDRVFAGRKEVGR
jgi:hypothetical protein